MRQAIGIAVFFGMLGVTAFGLVLTPVFYVCDPQIGGSTRKQEGGSGFAVPSATSVGA